MQKRITELNPGLLSGAVLSIILHVGLFHEGLFNVLARDSKPAEIILDNGTIAVELTLMPSIASAPVPAPPEPVVESEQEIEPEPDPQKTIEPIIPVPVPVVDEPALVTPQELKEQTPPEPMAEPQHSTPEPQPEPLEEMPEPAMESIDQDGSLEEDKGAITEAVAQTACSASYPALSRRRGEEGSVTLSFDISASGKISNIQIIKSSGHKRLDKAAEKALSKARFTPAQQRGKPIASTLTQTFTFSLTND
jgi:protein TonB